MSASGGGRSRLIRAANLASAPFCSVRCSEVVSQLVDGGALAEQIVEIMAQFDIEVVPANNELVIRAGLLCAETRGNGLSLVDQYCLELAASRKVIAVTADRAKADLDIGLPIEAVR